MRRKATKELVNASRWSAYAAAGAAVALGGGAVAEADIYYSGVVNIDLRDQDPFDGVFQLTGLYTLQAGTNRIFQPAHADASNTGFGAAAIFVGLNGTLDAGAAGFTAGGFSYVSRLPYGQNVSALGFLSGVRQTLAWNSGYTYSQFLAAGGGYIGFRFDIGNGTQFGWLQVQMDGAPYNGWSIVDYAYADPGESIFTGQTAIPEAGSMGLLALGGMGLLMWRKRRGAKVVA
jgi:hypothetical protein